MLAVVVVREGELPAGGDETVAECAGRALLIGSGTAAAAAALDGTATDVRTAEAGEFHPAAWARQLAAALTDEPVVVLPSSADGRDLAPRLAAELGRPLLANAASITDGGVDLIRGGGRELHRVLAPERYVATLHPGLRGVVRDPSAAPAAVVPCALADAGDDVATPRSSPPCRPTRPRSTWPRRRASSAAARGSTGRRASSSSPPSARRSGPASGPHG